MLTKEGLPLLRYCTRDVKYMKGSDCSCGRTGVRTAKILGRVDDMLVIRGINFFQGQIELIITSIPEIGTHFQIVVQWVKHLDE